MKKITLGRFDGTSAVFFCPTAGATSGSTTGATWVFAVRVVPPDRLRPRRWRARFRAMGGLSSQCRLLSRQARDDLIINGCRWRAIERALGLS